MEKEAPRFLASGEAALTVEFGQTIDPSVNAQVRALAAALAAAAIPGIVETVPTYRSLLIHFDPRLISAAAITDAIRGLDIAPLRETATQHWIIPVCYDDPYAEDINEVAGALNLDPAEIVALHAQADYRVYMYGFAPGYMFLGGLPRELAISRRTSPRPPVPKGSLLIAGGQALIGHDPMPTGWYHIGRTPAPMFDATRDPPCFIAVGDRVSFEPIDAEMFVELEEAARGGAPIALRIASPVP
jgi:inhibitor of KinA